MSFEYGGDGDGLNGNYHIGVLSGDPVFTQVDGNVDFYWNYESPDISLLSEDKWSIQWTGFIDIPADGEYYFETKSNDGINVNINGETLINKWWLDYEGVEKSKLINLRKGKVPVKVNYLDNYGKAYVSLSMGGIIDGVVLPKKVIPVGMFHTNNINFN